MYIILDKLTGKYYTGNGWNAALKLALQLTKLRAEELVESMNMKVSRGWESGEYELVLYDSVANLATK